MINLASLQNRLFIFFASIIFSLVFTKYYFLLTHEYYEPASIEKMAQFEADKVFQKRVLVILIAKFISTASGILLDHSLKAICVITCVALLYGFHELVQKLSYRKLPFAIAYLIFVPVGWNYLALNSIYHSYDLPSLAFFCWGIVFFLQKRFFLFYLLFVVASLNRESTCFITIAVFALLLDLPKLNFRSLSLAWTKNKNLVFHCTAQAMLWFLVKAVLENIYKDNPGYFFEETLSMKKFLCDMWHGNPSWPYLQTTNFFGNPRCFLTLFACLWLAIPFLWQDIPMAAKRLFWVTLPYLLSALMFANLMESRVYHELNVVLAASVATGLGAKLSWSPIDSN